MKGFEGVSSAVHFRREEGPSAESPSGSRYSSEIPTGAVRLNVPFGSVGRNGVGHVTPKKRAPAKKREFGWYRGEIPSLVCKTGVFFVQHMRCIRRI